MGLSEPYERCFDEDVSPTNGCPECGGRVTTNSHETACDDCGLVLADSATDPGPEWSRFETDGRYEAGERTGAPRTPTRHDRGLSTEIGRYRDGTGRPLPGATRRKLSRLRTLHGQAKFDSKREHLQAQGLSEVRRLTSALELGPDLRNQACALFNSAHDADLAQGRSIEALAAVAIYAACRVNTLPRTQADVLAVAACDRSLFRATLRAVRGELGLELGPRPPVAFVPRLVSAVDAPEAVRERATMLARSLDPDVYIGANPHGVAAACVYEAAQVFPGSVTQRELAEAADVTPVTLRARWNTIRAEDAGEEEAA